MPLKTMRSLRGYSSWLTGGWQLAVMPIGRLHVLWNPRRFAWGVTFYPAGHVNTGPLNVVENAEDARFLTEAQAAASGVTAELVEQHAAVVFPCRFNWEGLARSDHHGQLEFIRELSSYVDRKCLDFIRYSLCVLGRPDDLPSRAGQLDSNTMMAGAILYNHSLRRARVVGGAAFHRTTTRGLGMDLEDIEPNRFPRDGEIGNIVQHALLLVTAMLEASDETSMFMQAMSLLEFLAFPDEFKEFKEVKKVIARYVARNATEYERLLDRFIGLTGKKDLITGKCIGFRTQVVHMGERIERLVPDQRDRLELLGELQRYIAAAIDHMIRYSEMSWENYVKVRDTLRPFEKS